MSRLHPTRGAPTLPIHTLSELDDRNKAGLFVVGMLSHDHILPHRIAKRAELTHSKIYAEPKDYSITPVF